MTQHCYGTKHKTKMKIWIPGENLYFKMNMAYCTLDKMLKIEIYLIVHKVKAKTYEHAIKNNQSVYAVSDKDYARPNMFIIWKCLCFIVLDRCLHLALF